MFPEQLQRNSQVLNKNQTWRQTQISVMQSFYLYKKMDTMQHTLCTSTINGLLPTLLAALSSKYLLHSFISEKHLVPHASWFLSCRTGQVRTRLAVPSRSRQSPFPEIYGVSPGQCPTVGVFQAAPHENASLPAGLVVLTRCFYLEHQRSNNQTYVYFCTVKLVMCFNILQVSTLCS